MGRFGWARSDNQLTRIVILSSLRRRILSQSTRALRIAIVAMLSAFLPGCIGIAHVLVDVAPVAIEVSQTSESRHGSHKIELVCLHYMGDSDAFVRLLSPNPPVSSGFYDWYLVEAKGQPVQFNCAGEKRYIGFPFIPLIPMGPTPEASKSRYLFLRVDSSERLFRVAVVGRKGSVTHTDLASARASAPPLLFEPTPKLGSPRQTDLFLEHVSRQSEYYRSVQWTKSDGAEVAEVTSDVNGDISSIKIRIKQL